MSRDCRIAKNKTCHKCGNLGHLAKICRKKNPGLKPKVHGLGQFSVEEESEDDKHLEDDQNDSEDPEYVWTLKNKKLSSFSVKINGQSVKVLIDSASVNLVDKRTYDNFIPMPALKKTSVKIYPYGSEKPLNVLGMFHAKLSGSGEDRTPVTAKLCVTEGSSRSLTGQHTAVEIGLLRVGPEPSLVNKVNKLKVDNDKLSALPKSVQQILSNDAEVLDGIGKLKDFEVKLKVDPSVTPVSQRLRRLLYHTRKKVEDELDKLEDLGIIEKVQEPTPWISPLVVFPETNESVHLCLDMHRVNEAVIQERHMIPKLDELLQDVNGATVFSKIDLTSGYRQLQLCKESKNLTAFATHEGIYRYTCLILGINNASEIFQQAIEDTLAGYEGQHL